VLYECLTSSRPFPGDSVEQQIAGHLTTPPPRPSVTQPGVSPELDSVIAVGMAKDPDERYSTTTELARAARSAITAPIPNPPSAPDSQDTVSVSAPTQARAPENLHEASAATQARMTESLREPSAPTQARMTDSLH
jgi:serine/threonine protein kinase